MITYRYLSECGNFHDSLAPDTVFWYIGFTVNNPARSPSDEIHAILKEISISHQKLQDSQKETGLQIRELKDSQLKTDLQIRKLKDSQLKTDLQIQKQGGQFNERWGKMIESLVSGKCLRLLQERGIQVKRIYPNAVGALERKGKVIKNREFDIIAANGKETVVFEVKTILTVKSINDFLEVIPNFSKYLPEHKGKTLYAGMAYLKANEHATEIAEEQGLFVIRATGDSASLVNKKSFKPKVFPS